MKILVSWLREFVDVPDSAEEIGAKMSVRGFAVEGIEQLPGGDAVLDFEVTGNRPDCMSVLGMAREVATAYGKSISTRPEVRPAGADQRASLPITIENFDLCGYYGGAIADVTVGPSPEWMQARLKAGGIRPISNIVDITNYVLLELGQPMHAFDLATLEGGEIRVRPARSGERIRTLDGEDRALTPDALVIADATKPVAVAGVMGGADSEVSGRTNTIVFESAYFNPLSVRRTSKRLGLKTEASMRFERGADPVMPGLAMLRACTLLEQIGAGTLRGTAFATEEGRVHFRRMLLRRSRIGAFLGLEIPDADVWRILGCLGFIVEDAPDGWTVTVPPRRVDVTREVDLLEELARHYGFDRLPSHFPALGAAPAAIDPRITAARRLRSVLTGAGFSEAVTFGFIGEAAATPFVSRGDDVVRIANPLSENYAVLRPSILPGLLGAIAHNRRREQRDVRLFEIGNRFTRGHGERRALACAWTGAASPSHWSGTARDVDFFDVKGLIDRAADTLGVQVTAAPAEDVPWLVPGRAAWIVGDRGTVGVFGQVAPALADAYELPAKDPVFVAEIDLDAAAAAEPERRLQVEPLPRFPSVTRDISMLVDDTLPAAAIRDTVRQAAPETLISVAEFDRYQGKGVPEGKISLSLRLTFRSPDRTLTDADVQAAMDAVLAALKDAHNAVQR